MAPSTRKNIEGLCLIEFDRVLSQVGAMDVCRGYGANNRFDPNFGLVGQQRFQFGDLRVNLADRIVVIEVESAGGTTNLVKYWPLAATLDRPLLLLHGFGQGSANDYLSHLLLWDFLWERMRLNLWRTESPQLFARRFEYGYDDGRLKQAANLLHDCITRPLDEVLSSVFAFPVFGSNHGRSSPITCEPDGNP